MKRSIIVQALDEHNSIPNNNWFVREENTSYEVVCYRNYEIMHPNFDVVHCVDESVTTNHYSQVDRLAKVKRLQEFVNELDGIFEATFQRSQPHLHPYKSTFGNLAREMLQGNVFFKPRRSDYESVKAKLEPLGPNLVCVNGRNVHSFKAHNRNNSLLAEIKMLLNAGFVVLNCTIPNPKLPISHPNYLEVGNECLDYSVNISYFLCSKALLSVGNAGAITNHMSTEANVIITGEGGWVDNREFGHEGISILEAKSRVMGNAFHLRGQAIVDKIRELAVPENVQFFD